jgi:hypothetical protein
VKNGGEYRQALEAIASLRPKVDLFFDKVLVNAEDTRVRQNRLALLHGLLTEFSSIADFSEIILAACASPMAPEQVEAKITRDYINPLTDYTNPLTDYTNPLTRGDTTNNNGGNGGN